MSNALAFDKKFCQEQEDMVRKYDAQLESLFGSRSAYEDDATSTIQRNRVEAIQNIKMSKRNRGNLIIEEAKAHQIWMILNNPSQEEESELRNRLDRDNEEYWRDLKAKQRLLDGHTHSPEVKMLDLADSSPNKGDLAEAGPDAKTPMGSHAGVKLIPGQMTAAREGRLSSISSLDITEHLASSEEGSVTPRAQTPTANVPTDPQREASPARLRRKNVESQTTAVESIVAKVSGRVRAGKDHMHDVLRSIGNLRRRRRTSNDVEG